MLVLPPRRVGGGVVRMRGGDVLLSDGWTEGALGQARSPVESCARPLKRQRPISSVASRARGRAQQTPAAPGQLARPRRPAEGDGRGVSKEPSPVEPRRSTRAGPTARSRCSGCTSSARSARPSSSACGGRLKGAPTLAEDRPQRPKAAAQQLDAHEASWKATREGPQKGSPRTFDQQVRLPQRGDARGRACVAADRLGAASSRAPRRALRRAGGRLQPGARDAHRRLPKPGRQVRGRRVAALALRLPAADRRGARCSSCGRRRSRRASSATATRRCARCTRASCGCTTASSRPPSRRCAA